MELNTRLSNDQMYPKWQKYWKEDVYSVTFTKKGWDDPKLALYKLPISVNFDKSGNIDHLVVTDRCIDVNDCLEVFTGVSIKVEDNEAQGGFWQAFMASGSYNKEEAQKYLNELYEDFDESEYDEIIVD